MHLDTFPYPRRSLVPNSGWESLTSSEKKRIVIAGVGVLGFAGLALWLGRRAVKDAEPKKDYGITVDQLCVNATVTDPEKLRRALEDTYDTQVSAGVTNPFSMTTAFFGRVAPQCQVHPEEARSPKEAAFFLVVFMSFLEQLEIDDLITDDESRASIFEAMAWASRAGWKPTEQLVPLIPAED